MDLRRHTVAALRLTYADRSGSLRAPSAQSKNYAVFAANGRSSETYFSLLLSSFLDVLVASDLRLLWSWRWRKYGHQPPRKFGYGYTERSNRGRHHPVRTIEPARKRRSEYHWRRNTAMHELFLQTISTVREALWGWWTMAFIAAVSIFLSVRSGFFQVTHFGYLFRHSFSQLTRSRGRYWAPAYDGIPGDGNLSCRHSRHGQHGGRRHRAVAGRGRRDLLDVGACLLWHGHESGRNHDRCALSKDRSRWAGAWRAHALHPPSARLEDAGDPVQRRRRDQQFLQFFDAAGAYGRPRVRRELRNLTVPDDRRDGGYQPPWLPLGESAESVDSASGWCRP